MAFFECLVGGSGDGSTLTVTCYSGFAGLTISITNGVDTFSDVCPSTSPYEVVFDGLANGTWTLSTVYNGETYTKIVEVNSTSHFNPVPDGATATPTDDIQTWLNCADIWDKNYTTINEVLADASTLQALIATNNAADYMARSTTWASSVTSNSNAMTYIGANDYCADALLDNSTWLNAICNSTYFESVLNVKVPTMTSNTTPSGEVTASKHGSINYPYMAFDGNNSTYWNTYQSASGDGVNQWIMYQFTKKVRILKVKLRPIFDGNLRVQQFYFDTSDDGNTFDSPIYSGSLTNSSSQATDHYYICSNANKRNICRLFVQNCFGSPSIGVAEIQMYGRA